MGLKNASFSFAEVSQKASKARIAQSVEHSAVNRSVVGSSPTWGAYLLDNLIFILWPHGQAVKTSPFHGGNTSSILVGVIFITKFFVMRMLKDLDP